MTTRRTRRVPADDGGADRWLGTYGDAVTLLMAFFVMLYAISQVDQRKFEAFLSGLDVFGNKSAGLGVMDDNVGIVGDHGYLPTPAASADVSAPVALAPHAPSGTAAQDEAVERTELEAIRQQISDALDAAGLTDVADFTIDERGLVVSIAAEGVLFDTGSTVIGEIGQRIVATVAGVLRDIPNHVLIEGHTDDVPLRRGTYTNWNLSTDRAVSVLALLAQQHGITQRRMGAVGYGEFRPRVPNDSSAHRAANRRVDVVVIATGDTRV